MNKAEEFNNIRDLSASAEKLKHKHEIGLKLKDNQNELLPLDVKALAKESGFKAGLFTGRIHVKEVAEKFQKAEDSIFTDKSQIKHRREFTFGYLFTDIALHVKKGKKGILVWATSLKTGKPVADASIRIMYPAGGDEKLTTDKSGLAFFPEIEVKREQYFTVVA
ncbi:MAG: hypothetical protein H0V66_11675, partial [Bdellovibrionales bacterium]|nr:hypothetical protein [Bdellovibrionales bacterium]